MKKRLLILLVPIVMVCAILAIPPLRRAVHPVIVRITGRSTVAERVDQYGPAARAGLRPHFDMADIPYPPQRIVLVGLKEERRLEVYATLDTVANDSPRFICDYPILGLSGKPGPKLREGDRQVPEGIYHIESLNPNSRFHLSLRLDYPNAFDQRMAAADGRTDAGGDIFIHGGTASIGCLAMGDGAIEELFILIADVGCENVEVLLVPHDLRIRDVPAVDQAEPPWLPGLYADLTTRLHDLQP